jgi:hypothetical protein
MAERAGSRTYLRRLPISAIAATVLAIVAAVSLAQRIPAASHRYDDLDFDTFYGWWTDYSNGINPWVGQSKQVDSQHHLSRRRDCNYTPFFVEVFSPFARLDQKTAFWFWEVTQMICLVAAVLLLARGNDPPLGAAPTIIVLSLGLLSRQFAGELVHAQVTPTLLVLLSASWLCARRDRPAATGLCLALAALVKLYPVTVGGFFLFNRRWRTLGWAIGFFVAGVMLTNPAHWIELATQGLSVSYRQVAESELTVLAFVRKSIAHLAGTTIATAPLSAVIAITALIDLALLAIAAAATTMSRGRADLDGLLFGMWVALALLMSPLAWIHETLLLIPAYLFGTLAAWEGLQRREATRHILLIAGSVILAGCIATALIKALPHPGFAMLLGSYFGVALIFRARVMQSDVR